MSPKVYSIQHKIQEMGMSSVDMEIYYFWLFIFTRQLNMESINRRANNFFVTFCVNGIFSMYFLCYLFTCLQRLYFFSFIYFPLLCVKTFVRNRMRIPLPKTKPFPVLSAKAFQCRLYCVIQRNEDRSLRFSKMIVTSSSRDHSL